MRPHADLRTKQKQAVVAYAAWTLETWHILNHLDKLLDVVGFHVKRFRFDARQDSNGSGWELPDPDFLPLNRCEFAKLFIYQIYQLDPGFTLALPYTSLHYLLLVLLAYTDYLYLFVVRVTPGVTLGGFTTERWAGLSKHIRHIQAYHVFLRP